MGDMNGSDGVACAWVPHNGADAYTNTIIEHNHIYNFADHAIDLYGATTGVTIRYNKMHTNIAGGDGQVLKIGETNDPVIARDFDVYYNLMYDFNDVGVYATDWEGTFYNNVLYDFKKNGANLSGGTVYNNIFYKCATDNGENHSCMNLYPVASVAADYNLFYDSTTDILVRAQGVNYSTVAAYYAATGKGEHSINTDPLFANAAAGDFGLMRHSPCIDAGADVGLTSDFEGNVVPRKWAPDIGAFEAKYTARQKVKRLIGY